MIVQIAAHFEEKISKDIQVKRVGFSEKVNALFQKACVGGEWRPVFAGIPVYINMMLEDGILIEWTDGTTTHLTTERSNEEG